MGSSDRLEMLKFDLQICHSHADKYLEMLLKGAERAIGQEGILLEDTVEDALLLTMYAAYLYRKRAEQENKMPRMLRYALNNRLLSQKMKGAADSGEGDGANVI